MTAQTKTWLVIAAVALAVLTGVAILQDQVHSENEETRLRKLHEDAAHEAGKGWREARQGSP